MLGALQFVPLVSNWESTFGTWFIIQQLFACVNICHCLSWWYEIGVLVGKNGLDPIDNQLKEKEAKVKKDFYDDDEEIKNNFEFKKFKFLSCPTIFWINQSTKFLELTCLFGVILSLCIIFGVTTIGIEYPYVMILLWWGVCLINSSISQVSSIFSLQTETIMVEVTFLFGLSSGLSIFSNSFWIQKCGILIFGSSFHDILIHTPNISILLLRWLAFRTMFSAGLVKWYGSSQWKKLTAMNVHYQTMPIPSKFSKKCFELPTIIHKFETLSSLIIEGPICLMCLLPFPLCRIIPGFLFVSLMIVINITGIFCYLGILTSVICSSLFDDSVFGYWIFTPSVQDFQFVNYENTISFWDFFGIVIGLSLFLFFCFVTVCYFILSICCLMISAHQRALIPRILMEYYVDYQHTGLVNIIQFFSIMTTYRWELIFEGSIDGKKWKRFIFNYKPSHPNQIPSWNPIWYWPRIDWHLWIIPLRIRPMMQVINGQCLYPVWIDNLMNKILQYDKNLMKLIKFPSFDDDKRIKFVRVMMYDYRYTSSDASIRNKISQEAFTEVRNFIQQGDSATSNVSSSKLNVTFAPKNYDTAEVEEDLNSLKQTIGEWWIETGPIALVAEKPNLKYR